MMVEPQEDILKSVAVVIPCYNHGQFLLEAIASVENEPEFSGELVIVNDGSTSPTTLAILDQLRDKQYPILDTENQGLSEARNHGIRHTSSPYILPLDADNQLEPGFLKASAKVLEENSSVGVVYGDRRVFGEHDQQVKLANFDLGRLLLGNFIDACALFRRKVWEDAGGYDSKIPDQLGYEDWDFWLGAVEAGWKFHYLEKAAFRYRSRPGSMVSGCNLPANRKRLFQYICSKHYGLYSAQFPEVFATKEAQRLEALDEAFEYSVALSEARAALAIAQQERDQYYEKNQILQQRIQQFETDNQARIAPDQVSLQQVEASAEQAQYWQTEHSKVLAELNNLRQIHQHFLDNPWWKAKAKMGRLVRSLMGRS